MTQVEKKVQDCDKTFEYCFEFNVRVKFVGQGIRVPEHEEEAIKSAIASRIEEGAYLDPQFSISHTCYEVDGVDRDELMKDKEFFKTHSKHYTDVEEVEVEASYTDDDIMEEWET